MVIISYSVLGSAVQIYNSLFPVRTSPCEESAVALAKADDEVIPMKNKEITTSSPL